MVSRIAVGFLTLSLTACNTMAGAGKDVQKIPMTFGDALDALEADEVVKKALPGDMYRVFMHYKRDEWEKFMATVTHWDLQQYWDYLP